MSETNDTERIVFDACRRQFEESRAKIQHCIEQLNDEQLWARLSEEQNSIANLLLHLAGNVRQWIVAGLGGADDVRDRPREFAERGPLSRAEVVGALDAALADVFETLGSGRVGRFSEQRRVQGFETTVVDALLHTTTHFQGHTQEIVAMTRYFLGGDYAYDFVPQGAEQGATSEADSP